jgi:glycosyltransferase involved in cell wall biosynthesis
VAAGVIRKEKIDVIISPDPFAKAWVSMLLAFVFRKKLLLSVYGGNIFDPYWKKLSLINRVYSWVGRVVFNYAHAIQTDGLETFEILKKRYGKKVFWKPMVPMNLQDFLSIPRNTEAAVHATPNILYVGRLIEQKNIPLLVKIIKSLKGALVTFTIVGDGPKSKLLKGLEVTRYAHQNRTEIVERFKEADMLILTSYFEGFARVIMEAALAGIPVVTTNVSGIQGIVEDGCSGYVIEQGNETAFLASVRTLIENASLRKHMGATIRQKARAMLSMELMEKKQKEVFDYLK